MNTSSLRRIFATVAGILGTLAIAIYIAGGIVQTASSAEKTPATASSQRLPSYFPNTEELGPDEIRITALGT